MYAIMLTRTTRCLPGLSRQALGAPLRRGAPRSRSSWLCAATSSAETTSTDFSSIAAWEAEYAEVKKAKGIATSAAEKGGDVLAKSLPGFGAIGSAFERAFNKDANPQKKMMSENELAKQGEKQLDPPPMDSYRIVNTFEHTKESFTQARQLARACLEALVRHLITGARSLDSWRSPPDSWRSVAS
jgi:hypothetical protein